MSTSSAHPANLLRFAADTRQRSLTLTAPASRLGASLDRFRSSGSQGRPPIPRLDQSVLAHRAQLVELAMQAEVVARAYLLADGLAIVFTASGWRIVPLPPVLRRAVAGLGMTEDQLVDLGVWLLGVGRFAASHQGEARALAATVSPVLLLFTGRVSPSLVAKILGSRAAVDLGVLSTALSVSSVIRQGNPVRAFQERGSNYVADVVQVGRDAALTLFAADPSPETAAVAVGAVGLWAEWKAFDEVRRAAGRGLHAADELQDRVRDEAVASIHAATAEARRMLGRLVIRQPVTGGGPGPVFPLVPPVVRERMEDGLDELDDAADVVDAKLDAAAERARRLARAVKRKADGAVAAAEKGAEIAVDGVKAVFGQLP